MQDLLNTRRKKLFSSKKNFLSELKFSLAIRLICVPKHQRVPSTQAPDTSAIESVPTAQSPIVPGVGRQGARRGIASCGRHNIQIHFPTCDITFHTLAPDNRRAQPSRRENRARPLAIQISAHATDLKITRIRDPIFRNRLNRRQRTKILDLRVTKLPFRHIDLIHPTKRNTILVLVDYHHKRTHPNGTYYHFNVRLWGLTPPESPYAKPS